MIEDVNPYLIKMLGYSREEFIKKKLWEVGAFKDIESSQDAFEALQKNEYIRYEDLPLKAKDGRLIQVEFVSSVYLVDDEKVIQCDIRDNTEHRQIIAALQQNEKKYHNLVNQSPDGIFIIASSGNILVVNTTICRELKFSEEELLSMNIWDIIPEQYLDQHKKRLTRILAGESLVDEVAEYVVKGKDGKNHYVEILVAPHYSDKGIIGFQGVARDVTARKQMERALRMLNEDQALVNTLNEAVNRGENLDGIVEIFTRELGGIITPCRATVYLLDSNAKYIELLSSMILSSPIVGKIENLIGRPIPNLKIPIKKDSYFQKILGNEQGDVTSDPKIIQRWIAEFTDTTSLPPLIRNGLKQLVPQIYQLLNIKSVATVPLMYSGKTIGLLDITTSESVLTEDDLKRIRNISSQVTAVILRKQAEEELQFRNTILSTQQEATIDGILVVDGDNHIVSYNHRFVEMWRIPPELVEKKADEPVLAFVMSKVADPQSFIQHVQYLYEQKQETSRDEIVLQNGRIFDRYSAPMVGPDNQYYGRVWYFRDITESKQVEASLQESEERYRKLVENLPDGVVIHSQGKVIFANPASATIIGASSPADLIGKPVIEFVHPDYRALALKRVQNSQNDGALALLMQEKFVRQDGTQIDVEVSGIPFPYAGQPAMLTVLMTLPSASKQRN